MNLQRGKPVTVEFAGLRKRSGPLALGQLNIWEWLAQDWHRPYAVLRRTYELPHGITLSDITEALAVLLARHEGLRSHYVGGDPPTQLVAGAGQLPVDIYLGRREDLDPGHDGVVTAGIATQLPKRPFDLAAEFPIRVVVVCDGGTPHSVVIDYSHLAVDLVGARVVGREFAELVADRHLRTVGEPRHQPLDQVEMEQRPAERKRATRALEYWDRWLRVMPPTLYHPADLRLTGKYPGNAAEISSAAAAAALRQIATRTQASHSSIVLAAFCAAMSCRYGYSQLVLPTLTSNRSRPHLRDYVGNLAQSTILALDVMASTFDELVRRSMQALLKGLRNGMYDIYRRIEISRRIEWNRGVSLSVEPVFNSIPEFDQAAGVPASAPVPVISREHRPVDIRWQHLSALAGSPRLDLLDTSDVLRVRLSNCDASRMPPADVESLLLAIERLIVAAASADLSFAAVVDALGLEQISRGPAWVEVDGCWVSIEAARRLIAEAFGAHAGTVVAQLDSHVLVAVVSARAAGTTPQAAHARCMSFMSGRLGTMAPQYYVLCDADPVRPRTADEWLRQRVVAAGTGREAGRLRSPAAGALNWGFAG